MEDIALVLSDLVVSLVLSLNWKQVLVVNDNYLVTIYTLKRLSGEGILSTTVDNESITCDCYHWPESNHPDIQFDGFLLLTSKNYEQFKSVVRMLQKSPIDVIHVGFRWIMALDFPSDPRNIADTFNEGDEVVIVFPRQNENLDKTLHNSISRNVTLLNESDVILDVWSLTSPGNQSVQFQKSGNWTNNKGLQISSQLFPTPFQNFHGRVLKISTLGSPPVIEPPLPGKFKWRGYMFRIINILADLLNFTYTVKEADNRLYGIEQKDGSWSGMIGELMKKEVDVAVGDLSWSPDRSLVVDFTKEVFPEAVTFIYKTPGFYSRAWILFESISLGIWICIAVTFVLSLSAFFIILLWEGLPRTTTCLKRKKKRPPAARNLNDVKKSSVFAIDTFYRVLVTQGCPKLPTGGFSRWVLGTWLIGCMILEVLYAGTLTSRLSTHRSPRPANSLRQLLKWHPDAKLAVRNNSLPHAFFEDSGNVWKNVWEKNMVDNIIPGKLHFDQTLTLVQNSPVDPPYVWIAERSMLERRMRASSTDPAVCDLYVGKEDIIRSDWALALVKNSPFLRKFNEKIQRMQYYGIINYWSKKHWELENATCQPSDGLNSAGQDTPISLGDIISLFLLLAMGYGLSFLALICELFIWRRNKIRKEKRKKRQIPML